MNTHAQLGFDMLKHSNRTFKNGINELLMNIMKKWDGNMDTQEV